VKKPKNDLSISAWYRDIQKNKEAAVKHQARSPICRILSQHKSYTSPE